MLYHKIFKYNRHLNNLFNLISRKNFGGVWTLNPPLLATRLWRRSIVWKSTAKKTIDIGDRRDATRNVILLSTKYIRPKIVGPAERLPWCDYIDIIFSTIMLLNIRNYNCYTVVFHLTPNQFLCARYIIYKLAAAAAAGVNHFTRNPYLYL